MKKFTKQETIALLIIFAVLVVISIPNFALSLRRARDQNRRDDMGSIQKSLDDYHKDFGKYPLSTTDGKFLACLKPGDRATLDKNGRIIANLIPCQWGKDSLINLIPGSTKVYKNVLPGDPYLGKGYSYSYFSDGDAYQIFAHFEGKDEPEYDAKIVARNISCGNQICNVGRFFACPIEKTISECTQERLVGTGK